MRLATEMPKFIPEEIYPTEQDVQDTFNLLLKKPITPRKLTPNWKWKIPAGYQYVSDRITTHGKKGLGEILWDAVVYRGLPVNFEISNDRGLLHVRGLDAPGDIHGVDIYRRATEAPSIVFPQDLREGLGIKLARKVIFSGHFPIWRVSEVTENSFKQWSATQRIKGAPFTASKILYQV